MHLLLYDFTRYKKPLNYLRGLNLFRVTEIMEKRKQSEQTVKSGGIASIAQTAQETKKTDVSEVSFFHYCFLCLYRLVHIGLNRCARTYQIAITICIVYTCHTRPEFI